MCSYKALRARFEILPAILFLYGMIVAMSTYFRNKSCPHCGQYIDAIMTRCPKCKENFLVDENGKKRADLREFYRFEHFLQLPLLRQILLPIIGYLGFRALGLIIGFIAMFVGQSAYGLSGQSLTDWLNTGSTNFWITIPAYVCLIAFLLLDLWKDGIKELFRSFKNPWSYLYGVGGFIAIIVFNLIHNFIIGLIFASAGLPSPGVNANEAGLREMMYTNIPLFFIVICIIGPLCEELTYRAGIFSFFARTKRWVAYVVSGIIFGLIHFSWDFSSSEAVIRELCNLPTYIGAGLVFGFIYEKGGISASFTAHMLNNVTSTIISLVSK